MALMHRALPLPIHAAIAPDRYFCNHRPGIRTVPIVPYHCREAVDTHWPDGGTPIRYFLKDPRPSDGELIPHYEERFTCLVSIETAGPEEHLPHSVLLKPRELRGLAGFLIEKCAAENGGLGGFVTLGISSALEYVHNPGNDHWGGNFLTISIQPARKQEEDTYEPGSHSQNVAALLSAHAASFVPDRDQGPHNTWYYAAVSAMLRECALQIGDTYDPDLTWWSENDLWEWWAKRYNHSMHLWNPNDGPRPTTLPLVGGGQNVWNSSATNTSSFSGGGGAEGGESDADDEAGSSQTDMGGGSDTDSSRTISAADTLLGLGKPDNGAASDSVQAMIEDGVGDMTYQCDDTLGSGISPVDCEKLAWSGLKPPDSVETLQAGVPNFYSQGTCALGISSPTSTTILWSHLLAAFDALNTLCLQNPIKSVKGGRAYFGKQPLSSWINGKVRRDGAGEAVSSMEALPRGINATIFRHVPGSTLLCEWGLAGERKDVGSCGTD